MKKMLCLLLAVAMLSSLFIPMQVMAEIPQPALEFTFDKEESYKLYGNARVEYDEEKGSNVLNLDGSNLTYAEFPQGFFDGRDQMTISMDVKSNMGSGNFFTFTYGASYMKRAFLRTRGFETVFDVACANYGEDIKSRDTFSLSTRTYLWENITIVVDNDNYTVYVNGVKQSELRDSGVKTSDLGSNLKAYLGKSFYAPDLFFNGSFDNVKVYDTALDSDQVLEAIKDNVQLITSAVIGTTAPKESYGTDNHTASNTIVNPNNKTITPYVRRNADLKSLQINLKLVSDDCTVTIDGKDFENNASYDLTKDRTIAVTYQGRTETYTLKAAKIAYNNVVDGKYADPDIEYINGKWWMFPTTDGYTWWGGYEIHAFSSTDLVNWNDEGIILNLRDDNPGKNIKGIQIASVPWSDGRSWAPTVEYKNGKCYVYFCGGDSRPGGENRMAIGVAVADNPAGPYKVKETPIVSFADVRSQFPSYTGETIDPSIFTDDDGTSYLLFGGSCVADIAKLNNDMMSIDMSTMAEITGANDFLESVYVIKRNGLYHFTWSCYGTNGQDYAVKYGIASSITPDKNRQVNVDYKYTVLDKNLELGLLCTGHQGVYYSKDLDRCFMAYHRFCTPLEEYTEGYGFHRETCIDEVFFDENGLMKVVIPSMEGTGKVTTKPCSDLNVSIAKTIYEFDGTAKKPAITVKDSAGKAVNTSNYTVTYKNNVNVGDATAVVKFKGAYAGTVEKKFRITPKVVLSQSTFTYDGKTHKPTVTAYDHAGKINQFLNYKVSYSSGLKNIGTYTVTVEFIGDYNDVVTKTFTIAPSIKLSADSYTYDGKVKKPTVTVKGANGKNLSSSNYTVSYSSGRKNVGKYTVTVKFKNGHSGTYSKTFVINPPATSIKSLTPGAKKITVKWTKKTTQTTGYQIQYATNSKFSKAKTITVTSNKTTSKTISKLTAKKKYYVRIRTYKTVGSTKYYSPWSKANTVTTK